MLAASSEATFDSELAALVAEEASIVVLLAEAFDGAVVRTVLSQVRQQGQEQGAGGGGGDGRESREDKLTCSSCFVVVILTGKGEAKCSSRAGLYVLLPNLSLC